jgi:hypothetical protein
MAEKKKKKKAAADKEGLSEIDEALGLGGDEEMWMPEIEGLNGYGNPFDGRNAF